MMRLTLTRKSFKKFSKKRISKLLAAGVQIQVVRS